MWGDEKWFDCRGYKKKDDEQIQNQVGDAPIASHRLVVLCRSTLMLSALLAFLILGLSTSQDANGESSEIIETEIGGVHYCVPAGYVRRYTPGEVISVMTHNVTLDPYRETPLNEWGGPIGVGEGANFSMHRPPAPDPILTSVRQSTDNPNWSYPNTIPATIMRGDFWHSEYSSGRFFLLLGADDRLLATCRYEFGDTIFRNCIITYQNNAAFAQGLLRADHESDVVTMMHRLVNLMTSFRCH